MFISLKPLDKSHFYILLKWMEAPHIKYNFNFDKVWEAIESIEKQTSGNIAYSFMIYLSNHPVGLILFSKVSFAYSKKKSEQRIYNIDILIGDEKNQKKGIALSSINEFISNYCSPSTHLLATIKKCNTPAIKLFEKAGFEKLYIDMKDNIFLYPGNIFGVIDFCINSNFGDQKKRHNYRISLYDYAFRVLNNKKQRTQEELNGLIQCLIGLGLAEDSEAYFEEAFKLVNRDVPGKILYWLNMGMGFSLEKRGDNVDNKKYFSTAHHIAKVYHLGSKLAKFPLRWL